MIVALQCVEDIGFFGLFAAIVSELRRNIPVRADLYILRSLSSGSSRSLRSYIQTTLTSNFLTDRIWKLLYFSFCDRIAYRSAIWMAPWIELRIFLVARRALRSITSVDMLAAMTARGIKIGDLVIDSYLRFKPSPTVELDDRYLEIVIRQALRDIEKSFRYFDKVKPELYLTSYTTYVQHGVAARVAAACGVRVLSFGNFQDFSKLITSADHCQAKNSESYSADFSLLPDRTAKIEAADKFLSGRVAGQIDPSTAYMKISPWQGGTAIPREACGSLVIFLHDFYDGFHVYSWALFHDFWNWICFTIDVLDREEIHYFIKPHPNQIVASDEAFAALRRKYPGLRTLPPEINNRQLAEAGIAGAVTLYGSIASEMAYLGIPTISCGDNPHTSFDFCLVARTLAEYEKLLRDFRESPVNREELREQACAHFYMHNLNLPEDALELRDRSIKLRTNIWCDPERQVEDIIVDFQKFEMAQSLKTYCKELLRAMDSGW